MSEKIKVPVIPDDVEIKATFKGSIYARLSQFIFANFKFDNDEEMKLIIDAIKSGKSDTIPKAYHMETILAIHSHLEQCAKDQGLVTEQEIDKPVIEEEN